MVLPYSSGTTGLPKGVMLTHYNLVANILQSASAMTSLREDDTVLGVLPFFHIYGMVVIMNLGLHVGATVVTMPRFELEPCLEVMQRYKITFANVVPPMVLALRETSGGRQVRPLEPAHALLRRRPARRKRGRGRRGAPAAAASSRATG